MILGRRRSVAVLAAAAIVASGAMWAPAAAQTPTNCVPVPGGTAGTSVKVGSVKVDVPAISNIELCAGGASVPQYRVEFSGGACTSSCLSVYAGGGTLSAGSITVRWTETVGTTSTPKEQVVDPDGVTPPVGETCVLSTGAPVPANEACEIAIGVVPPPDALGPVVDAAEATVQEAIATVFGYVDTTCATVPDNYNESTGEYADFCANPAGWAIGTGGDAGAMTCGALPDRYDPQTGETYDACTNTSGWASSLAQELLGTTCDNVPDRTDPDTGQTYDFCTDPWGWAGAVSGDAYRFTCASIPDWTDPATGWTYDFCTDAVGWTAAVTRYVTKTSCDAVPPVYDPANREYRFCEDPVGWLNVWLEYTEQTCNYSWPAYDPQTGEYVYPCEEPGRWLDVMLETWCGNLCDLPPPQELIRRIREILAEQQIQIYWSRL